jgi:predicted cupin superfamily sugar epimerase
MSLADADKIIKKLDLLAHPEGGYYKQSFRDPILFDFGDKYDGRERNLSTAIYFLLKGEDKSALHRIKHSAETWHYHAGCPILITVFNPFTKEITTTTLGHPIDGYSPQYTIPGNMWFGAKPIDKTTYSLCGCTVAPGFDFRDFALITRDELLKLLPNSPENLLDLIYS